MSSTFHGRKRRNVPQPSWSSDCDAIPGLVSPGSGSDICHWCLNGIAEPAHDAVFDLGA